MGFWGELLGAPVRETVTSVADVIDRFVETKEEKEAAEILRMKMQQEPDKWQAEINKIEASHRSMFVAGWRPAVGWICVLALFWGWFGARIAAFIISATGSNIVLPRFETGEAVTLLMALLGMAGLRSYEKKKGLTG